MSLLTQYNHIKEMDRARTSNGWRCRTSFLAFFINLIKSFLELCCTMRNQPKGKRGNKLFL